MKDRFIQLLTRNWTLKLFSLGVASLLFLFVSVESGNLVEVSYPLLFETPRELMITSEVPPRLTATLRGPWANFRNFSNVKPVVIKLDEVEPGTIRRRIETDAISPPAGMSVVALRPSEVEITLDRVVEKLVMVEVDPLGRPAFGFEIASMRADPPRVRVAGPLNRMRTLDFVHTKPVPLRDLEESLEEDVNLQPPLPPLRLVDRTSVTVYVDIVEEFAERTLELPVVLANAPRGSHPVPEVVTVTLKGPRRFVDRLDKESMAALVDLRGGEELEGVDTVEKIVAFRPELPERTQVVGGAPKVAVLLGKRRRN